MPTAPAHLRDGAVSALRLRCGGKYKTTEGEELSGHLGRAHFALSSGIGLEAIDRRPRVSWRAGDRVRVVSSSSGSRFPNFLL